MLNKIPKILDGKVTFIIGSDKNAGKTTFLNYASRRVKTLSSPVLVSVGIDGEKQDSLLSIPKPQVLADEDDYIITTDKMLCASSGRFQIMEVFPFRTVLGRVLLAKTIRKGYVELVGPEHNEQLSDILNYVKNEKGLNTILVDGAVNRLTQVSTSSDASFIYVLKVTNDNLNSSIEKMRSIYLLNSIKKFDGKKSGKHVELNGALTKNKLEGIEVADKSLVLEDFTRVFLDYNGIKKLLNKTTLYFKTIFKLQCFVVNLVDIDISHFDNKLDDDIRKLVMYNPYMEPVS